MIGFSDSVRAAFGPSWRVYAAPGRHAADGLLELFEAEIDAHMTHAIDARRADFESLVADGRDAFDIQPPTEHSDMDHLARMVARRSAAARHQRISDALCVAAILAWEAACKGSRHEAASAYIETMVAADPYLHEEWSWFIAVAAELQRIGAIGDGGP